jgi:hypothetical protein
MRRGTNRSWSFEDEEALRMLLGEILSKLGYRVSLAAKWRGSLAAGGGEKACGPISSSRMW